MLQQEAAQWALSLLFVVSPAVVTPHYTLYLTLQLTTHPIVYHCNTKNPCNTPSHTLNVTHSLNGTL